MAPVLLRVQYVLHLHPLGLSHFLHAVLTSAMKNRSGGFHRCLHANNVEK
jgi:hypothetical protein